MNARGLDSHARTALSSDPYLAVDWLLSTENGHRRGARTVLWNGLGVRPSAWANCDLRAAMAHANGGACSVSRVVVCVWDGAARTIATPG
jgi:hypothetical protein